MGNMTTPGEEVHKGNYVCINVNRCCEPNQVCFRVRTIWGQIQSASAWKKAKKSLISQASFKDDLSMG